MPLFAYLHHTKMKILFYNKVMNASQEIDNIITTYGGWKGNILSAIREIVTQTDPEVIEEIKWKMKTRPEGLPVWSHNGIVCFAETWKDNVKLLFPKGAELKDPNKLFNSRLQSKDIRAIEFKEASSVDAAALQDLVQEAMKLNTAN